MSGIVGAYNLDGQPVERKNIQNMLDSIAHRGPDGSRVWTDGPVGLGHQMLWTTPESLYEKPPMLDETGNLAITADARIDNRDELISILNFNGRPKEAITDSEIILASYEKWEEACPEKLLGDFSFALWDGRKRRLFCARDPFGIKPFYYFFNGKTVRLASEPKAIYEDNKIAKEANLPLICLYLLNNFNEREGTLYRGIYRLLPSHFMVFEEGGFRKERYWDINPSYTIEYRTDEEYAEHLLCLFKDAVRVRLRSYGPVGASLSGGIDSSSIVCVARMLYQEKLVQGNGFEAFSLVFDKLPCDERFYINEVARKCGLKANYISHEENLRFLDIEQILEYSDMIYLPNMFFFAPVLKCIQEKGIKVLLYGIGGDDLLAVGYEHLTDLMYKGKLKKLIKHLRQDVSMSSHSALSLFLNYCIKPFIPGPIKTVLKQCIKPFRQNGISSLVNVDFLKKCGGKNQLLSNNSFPHFTTRSQQKIYESLYAGWNATLASDVGERFNAHFDIEARYPFFDRRLVEFLLAVPEEQRWNCQWPKAILRQSMVGILPESIRRRLDKAEFSCVVDLELKERQATKIEKLIQQSILVDLGIVNSDQLEQLFNNYRQSVDRYDIRNELATFVWLELWYRLEIEKGKGGIA